MSRDELGRTRPDNTSLYLILIGLVLLFFIAPGALIMSIVRSTMGLGLQQVQMLTFSAAISFFVLIILFVKSSNRGGALGSYVMICLLSAIILAVFVFGFEAEWAIESFQSFFPKK